MARSHTLRARLKSFCDSSHDAYCRQSTANKARHVASADKHVCWTWVLWGRWWATKACFWVRDARSCAHLLDPAVATDATATVLHTANPPARSSDRMPPQLPVQGCQSSATPCHRNRHLDCTSLTGTTVACCLGLLRARKELSMSMLCHAFWGAASTQKAPSTSAHFACTACLRTLAHMPWFQRPTRLTVSSNSFRFFSLQQQYSTAGSNNSSSTAVGKSSGAGGS